MFKWHKWHKWAILVMVLSGVLTGARAESDSATVESLMRSSGLWQQLSSMAPQIRGGVLQAVAQSGKKPSAAELDRLTGAVESAYRVDRLRATTQRILERDLDGQYLPALVRWYASPLGTYAARLEEQAAVGQVDPQASLRQGAALLASMSNDRRAVLEEFVVVTRSAEAITQMSVNTALAVHQGVVSVNPGGPGVSADELRASLDAKRQQMLKAFAGYALASYANVYETLSVEQLRQYVAFLGSEPGKHYNDASIRAFGEALVEASREFGQRLPGARDQSNT